MVSCISIVKTLQNTNIEIRGLGTIEVYPSTIEVGNNCVAARCHIVGTEGDMIIKCYHRRHPDDMFLDTANYYLDALRIVELTGSVEYVDVTLSRWVAGDALDVVLYNGDCDYAALSRAFDRMAFNHKRDKVVHSDVKPENIVVTTNGEMQLIDNDLLPRKNEWGFMAVEYGSSLYAHRNRRIRRTDEHTDDYPLALISVLLAAMAIDERCFSRSTSISENITIAMELLHKAGDTLHYNIALALQSSIMGKVDWVEELLAKCVQ